MAGPHPTIDAAMFAALKAERTGIQFWTEKAKGKKITTVYYDREPIENGTMVSIGFYLSHDRFTVRLNVYPPRLAHLAEYKETLDNMLAESGSARRFEALKDLSADKVVNRDVVSIWVSLDYTPDTVPAIAKEGVAVFAIICEFCETL